MSKQNEAIKATYFSIIGNFALAIIKGLAGIFGNSYALVADAIESTADVFSSALVLFGLKYAKRPPDEKHPYGHGRIEPLITFIVVGFLIVSAAFIAFEAIHKIQTPHKLPKPWTLLVLAPIIIWKEISYRIVMKKSRETGSSSLRADAWHHRSDAYTSVAAFLGISLALILGDGYENLDDWAALFAAGFIIYNSYKIFRPAFGEMMDEQNHDQLIEQIRTISLTVEGVKDTEKCFVRKTGLDYHVDLHAIVDGSLSVQKGHEIAHDLEDKLKAELPQLGHVLIHIEPHTYHSLGERSEQSDQ